MMELAIRAPSDAGPGCRAGWVNNVVIEVLSSFEDVPALSSRRIRRGAAQQVRGLATTATWPK